MDLLTPRERAQYNVGRVGDLERVSYSMKMQRPAVPYERNGRDTDRYENAAKTSFLNWEKEKVISADQVNGKIVRHGCKAVVAIQNPACVAS